MKRELTQFSMVEFRAFAAEPSKGERQDTRGRAMLAFEKLTQATEGWKAIQDIGGMDNLQRVRVLGDPSVPSDQVVFDFDLVPKLPPHQVKAKVEQEERKKKAEKFVADVLEGIGMLGVLAAAAALAPPKPAPKPVKKSPPKPRVPRTKEEIFKAAQEQDQANRRRAAREAAEKFRKEKQTKKAS